MTLDPDFHSHLMAGATTVARAWEINRTDGIRLGFTDHDRDLRFNGLTFSADAGLSAKALSTSTGLSVDNAEAVGALSDESIAEADILAGRFDSAEVLVWLVNWAQPAERNLLFRGTLGEITRSGIEFRAELRGLAEPLNVPQGRVFQGACSAVLGDERCGFDLDTEGYSKATEIIGIEDGRIFWVSSMPEFSDGWFDRGRLVVTGGDSSGLQGLIKADSEKEGQRKLELWEPIRGGLAVGDTLRLEAGCDKTAATCRAKFSNFLNFRGFPHIPGEDWMMSVPRSGTVNDGGSLSRVFQK